MKNAFRISCVVLLLTAAAMAQCTTPTGIVHLWNNQFSIGGDIALAPDGTYTSPALNAGNFGGAGTYQVQVKYSGDAYCQPSTSTSIVQVFNLPPSPTPTTATVNSSLSPALTTDSVTFSGSIVPSAPASPASKPAVKK